MNININEIVINSGRREVNPEKVQELARSIQEIGLLNPVTITQDNILIAGAHRISAFKLLGRKEIPYSKVSLNSLKAELAEIDENLIRSELHYLESGNLAKRKKVIYEELYPEVKKETFKGNRYTGSLASADPATAKPSFVEDTAKKTGKSSRVIHEEIQLATNLIPEAQAYILKEEVNPIEKALIEEIKEKKEIYNEYGEKKPVIYKDITKTEALKLARHKPEEQKQILKKLKEGKVKNVNSAVGLLKAEKREEVKKEQLNTSNNAPIIYLKSADKFIDEIENKTIDLLLTDPPYSTDVEIYFQTFLNTWIYRALDKVKDTGRAFIFAGPYPEEINIYLDIFLKHPRRFETEILIWTYRNTIGPTPKKDYKNNYQMLFHLRTPNSPDLKAPNLLEQFSVQDISAPDGRQYNRFHKWQKPEELIERIIRHTTKEGDLIIDPFAGSGTTLVVGGRLGRKVKGCDIDGEAIEIAIKRGCLRG